MRVVLTSAFLLLVGVGIFSSFPSHASNCHFSRLVPKSELELEIATAPQVFDLWKHLEVVPDDHLSRWVSAVFGKVSLGSKASEMYANTIRKHLAKTRGKAIPLSKAAKAVLIADEVLLNNLLLDLRDLEKRRAPSAEIDGLKKIILGFSRTALARYADLARAGAEFEPQDRAQLHGALEKQLAAFLEFGGEKYEKSTRETNAGKFAQFRVFPSKTPLGKFVAKLDKKGYRFAVFPKDALGYFQRGHSSGTVDPQRKSISSSLDQLVTLGHSRQQRKVLLDAVSSVDRVRAQEGPLSISFELNGKSWFAGSATILGKQMQRLVQESQLGEPMDLDHHIREMETIRQVSIRPALELSRQAAELTFLLHRNLLLSSFISNQNAKLLANPTTREQIGIGVVQTGHGELGVWISDGNWKVGHLHQGLVAQVPVSDGKLAHLKSLFLESLKADNDGTTHNNVLDVLAALKRKFEVAAGVLEYLDPKIEAVIQGMHAIRAGSGESTESLFKDIKALASDFSQLSTLRTIPQLPKHSELVAGDAAAKKGIGYEGWHFALGAEDRRVLESSASSKGRRALLEKLGMEAVIQHAVINGWSWKDVSADHVGYDLYLTNPKTGEEWFVEAKGRNALSVGKPAVTLEKNELAFAHQYPRNAVLAVAEAREGKIEVHFYKNYVVYPPNPAQGSSRFLLNGLRGSATEIYLDPAGR